MQHPKGLSDLELAGLLCLVVIFISWYVESLFGPNVFTTLFGHLGFDILLFVAVLLFVSVFRMASTLTMRRLFPFKSAILAKDIAKIRRALFWHLDFPGYSRLGRIYPTKFFGVYQANNNMELLQRILPLVAEESRATVRLAIGFFGKIISAGGLEVNKDEYLSMHSIVYYLVQNDASWTEAKEDVAGEENKVHRV